MSSSEEEDSMEGLSLPPANPMFEDEDSDSSDELCMIFAARMAKRANAKKDAELLRMKKKAKEVMISRAHKFLEMEKKEQEEKEEMPLPPPLAINRVDAQDLEDNDVEAMDISETDEGGLFSSSDDDEFELPLPEPYKEKVSPPSLDSVSEMKEKEKEDPAKKFDAVDYSLLFDEDGALTSTEVSYMSEDSRVSPLKRKSRNSLNIFKLKKKKRVRPEKGYQEIEAVENNPMKGKNNASEGIFKLMEDDEKQKDVGYAQIRSLKGELEDNDTARENCDKLNHDLLKKDVTDNFPSELLNIVSSRRLPVKQIEKEEPTTKSKLKLKSKPKSPKGKKGSNKSKIKRKSTVKTATKVNNNKFKKKEKVGLSIATMPPSLADTANNMVEFATRAADEIYEAANAKERKQKRTKGRTIVNRRRKAITDADPIVRRFGDITRMMVVLHVWQGTGCKPADEDQKTIAAIISGANIFIEMARKLGDVIASLCEEYFDLKENNAMKDVLKGLREETDEVHQRPTVRRVPAETAIDVWSGQQLNEDVIKGKASLILRPRSENDASACTLVLPKDVPAFLAVLHGAFHLEKYVQNYVQNALKNVDGLTPELSWKEVWEKCAGISLSKKATFTWPKGTKSKDSNPFTNVVVTAREFINVTLFVRDELEKAIAEIKKNVNNRCKNEITEKKDAEELINEK